jgi:uncharacterized protein
MKPIILVCTVICLLHLNILVNAQANTSNVARYTKVPTGYLMVLRQGDSVFQKIEAFVLKEKLASAHFTGIGFLGYARFGFFNKTTKEYDPKDFSDVEVVSLAGSIAWEGDKPSLHMHSTVSDKNMDAFGGHLLEAVVGNGSLEVYITLYDKRLERKMDPAISAKVLSVEENR